MMNLFEILQAAQHGQAMANMARQFGLSPAQTQAAVEALLPAFSMGLNRTAARPDLMSAFLGQLATGSHWRAFEAPPAMGGPVSEEIVRQGDAALNALFGSSDVSGQIARQAAASTGLGVEVVRRMMPFVASMLLGGISRSMQAQGFGALLEGLGRAISAGAASPGPAGFGQAPPGAGQAGTPFNPFDWSALMRGSQGPGQGQGQPTASQPGAAGNPFDAIFAGFFCGAAPAAPSRPEPPPPPEPPPQPTQAGFEALTRMFETGRQAQENYVAGLRSIFEPTEPREPR